MVDVLALAFAGIVCVYAVLPQSWLDGTADRSAVGLALKHDLIPVGAYFLGRSLLLRRERSSRSRGRCSASPAWSLWSGSSTTSSSRSPGGGTPPPSTTSTTSSATTTTARRPAGELHLQHRLRGPFLRRLVSIFLGPLATAYCFVVALIVAAALRRRCACDPVAACSSRRACCCTFSRSSLLALAAGLVVLAVSAPRWPVGRCGRRRSRSASGRCTSSRTSRRSGTGRSRT